MYSYCIVDMYGDEATWRRRRRNHYTKEEKDPPKWGPGGTIVGAKKKL